MASDPRQVGEDERDKVEVTPEMIEARIEAADLFSVGYVSLTEEVPLVSRVSRAMASPPLRQNDLGRS